MTDEDKKLLAETRESISGFAGYAYTHHNIGSNLMGFASKVCDRLESVLKKQSARGRGLDKPSPSCFAISSQRPPKRKKK